MKKIITLLFFVGFLTSAFAQPDRHQQYGNQTNENRCRSPKYSGDDNYTYSKSNHDNDGYHKNNQWDNRDNGNDYDRDRDRYQGDREHMKRNSSYHSHDNQKRIETDPYRTRSKSPLIRIIFGSDVLFQ